MNIVVVSWLNDVLRVFVLISAVFMSDGEELPR